MFCQGAGVPAPHPFILELEHLAFILRAEDIEGYK